MRFSKYNIQFTNKGRAKKGFTLVELLVVISIVSLLMAVLMPSLNRARQQAKAAICMSNIRQLSLAFFSYGNDYNYYTMPAADTDNSIYWWGRKHSEGIDHKAGIIWPYLKSELGGKSVFECPSQPFGSYQLQGKPLGVKDEPKWITSTYGYNGYYLCPSKSGWGGIDFRPWQKVTSVTSPSVVLAFADTLSDYDLTGKNPVLKNNFLLDPPYIFTYQGWKKNSTPTTCFRHNNKTNALFVDGHCKPTTTMGTEYRSVAAKIGSIGRTNAPYYVPDYRQWKITISRR